MFTKSNVALSAAIILSAVSAASAEDRSVPRIDDQKLCRASQSGSDTAMIPSVTNSFDACMKGEQTAREQLVASWATFTAAEKTQCVQPLDYAPSYVEWITCAEMTRDVRNMRKEQSADASGLSGGGCPIVQYQRDGSVVSVANCIGYGRRTGNATGSSVERKTRVALPKQRAQARAATSAE